MDMFGFPNALHFAHYAHLFAVETMRGLNLPPARPEDLSQETCVRIAHSTALTSSPWFALSEFVWKMRKPPAGWPKLVNLQLSAGQYLFRHDLWEMPVRLDACITLPCPHCLESHNFSVMAYQENLPEALQALSCPHCYRTLWPWFSSGDIERIPPVNVLPFQPQPMKGPEHATKNP